MQTVYTQAYLDALDDALSHDRYVSNGYKDRADERTFLAAERARATYALTREMHLPRQALYVPGEKPPKGKPIPLGPISKRVLELKKRHASLTPFDAAMVELRALLSARAIALPEAA